MLDRVAGHQQSTGMASDDAPLAGKNRSVHGVEDRAVCGGTQATSSSEAQLPRRGAQREVHGRSDHQLDSRPMVRIMAAHAPRKDTIGAPNGRSSGTALQGAALVRLLQSCMIWPAMHSGDSGRNVGDFKTLLGVESRNSRGICLGSAMPRHGIRRWRTLPTSRCALPVAVA